MPLPHRIAAGAIVFRETKILLVRYATGQGDIKGNSYLVAPGGAVEPSERLADAAVRETLEETGVTVAVRHPLAVEDLLCSQFRMQKTWFLCDFFTGQVHETQGARDEGITQAGWFSRDELCREVVFPSIVLEHDWAALASPEWAVKWLELRRASF
jgi:8-oxo-dGTP pyrophosphatase MutT (NUDIX family)